MNKNHVTEEPNQIILKSVFKALKLVPVKKLRLLFLVPHFQYSNILANIFNGRI